ncbi:MAG: blue (type 1) copper domain protein [Hydrocarboniphaga sp.]|uniref:cupredoxin domain-containing protein n=1 Tax=Hydrocarboniphaga sp. TaxID=2033016 RepID=UPI0026081EDC|nr:hypothetical protein [Hydrocarboniphaga sp.]MDB5970424.1 blue (type 1) copper domain protein [Hydrocarboniphaga sp.]
MKKRTDIARLFAAATLIAAASAAAGEPTADYQFNDSLSSSANKKKAPPLVLLASGNTYVTTTVDGVERQVLQFPLHAGLQLQPTTKLVGNGDYTIAVLAGIDDISGRRRLVDFKSGTSDSGLYEVSGTLSFPPAANGSSPAAATPGEFHQYVLTRNSSTGRLAGYLDGLPTFAVTDSGNLGVIGPENALRFFFDNTTDGTTGEDASGQVARIRLFPAEMNSEAVAQLDWIPNGPQHASTVNYTYVPANTPLVFGDTVEWRFYDIAGHTVTDESGSGAFDSGYETKGGVFTQLFDAAGTYDYGCSFHSSMHGTVAVAMTGKPAEGSISTSFTLKWALAKAASGFVYDVEIQRPSDASFVAFRSGTSKNKVSFVPDAGPGTYQFRARRRSLTSGAIAYSPALVIQVS